jgi:predicted kinase
VLRRAECVLSSGRSVIVDGTFRSREQRANARLLAQKFGAPFYFVECRATPEASQARLRERAKQPHVSDARVELFDEFVRRFEPVDEFSANEHIVADTSQASASETLRELERRLPAWPAGH